MDPKLDKFNKENASDKSMAMSPTFVSLDPGQIGTYVCCTYFGQAI